MARQSEDNIKRGLRGLGNTLLSKVAKEDKEKRDNANTVLGDAEYRDTFSAFEFYWTSDELDYVKDEHRDALFEQASDRIAEMVKEGYVEGELITYIRTSDEDGEDGVPYSGRWFPRWRDR